MSEFAFAASDADFETAVIERSAQTPVVVDFWAPWCAPCRALGPLLERLADEFGGAFLLAKVNIDESPSLAAAFQIRSVPMVLGFRDGQVVSEFVGALPETKVREFLTTVLPSEADRRAAAAEALYAAGKVSDAEAGFRDALENEARCSRALVGLAHILEDRQQDAEALELLQRVLPGPFRQEADRLAAQIRVRQNAGGDEAKLRARVHGNPADLEARLLLAQTLASQARYPEALDEYLQIVRRDRAFRDDAARTAMLDIFELLGARHETTEHYRSELAKVLFS
jgi:putative thioredoxin